MHELGHLILHHESSIDDEADMQSRDGHEREANAFAGRVLVPDTALGAIRDTDRPDEVERFDAWLAPQRHALGVSAETILRRLLDMGRLPQAVVLCRMLVANPLRIGQYAAMTFRTDGTGNLVRVAPGCYRLRFQPADFKNEKGAANSDYDVEVDPSVSSWIDRYLLESRPHLIGAGSTDRFFLPAVAGPRKPKPFLKAEGLHEELGFIGEGLASRVKLLTGIYIGGCPGFGPHSFRHIIATDHLRRHPGDYLTVAVLLHDKLETVLKSYGHLKVADGLRVLSAGIREASTQLAAARKAA